MVFLVFPHLREALTIFFFPLQVKLLGAASDEYLLFANDSISISVLNLKSGFSVCRLPDGRNRKGEKYRPEAAKGRAGRDII